MFSYPLVGGPTNEPISTNIDQHLLFQHGILNISELQTLWTWRWESAIDEVSSGLVGFKHGAFVFKDHSQVFSPLKVQKNNWLSTHCTAWSSMILSGGVLVPRKFLSSESSEGFLMILSQFV